LPRCLDTRTTKCNTDGFYRVRTSLKWGYITCI
jgi:hypothetical protein